MVIYTPRGLKIRLKIDYTFALMARLYPKVDAFKVLKMTEGFELIPKMLTFIVVLISFYLKIDPYQLGIYTIIASVLGTMITTFGVFFIPGLPKLSTIFSYISGFGILFVFIVVYGFISVGWQGVVAFFIGKFMAMLVNNIIGFWNTMRINKKIGIPLTLSEINFFNAYRFYASKLGKTTDIAVSDEELKEDTWEVCLEDLAIKWPEVVRRFTRD